MRTEKIFLKKIKPEMTDCRVVQIEKIKSEKSIKKKKNANNGSDPE